MTRRSEQIIVVRGGGDLATGTIHRLCRCGWSVLALETENPAAIRRRVAFCEAVYDGCATVEGMTCVLVGSLAEARAAWADGCPAMMVDPNCEILRRFRPWAVVDAIIAKRNLGTHMGMADKTVALGPGFVAGQDVNVVIETKRGHDLGRLIERGSAAPNTGVPGLIAGHGAARVVRAPSAGVVHLACDIGDMVERGQVIAHVDGAPVSATLTGVLRGIIRDGYRVTEGFKLADIDPRASERENCFTISDKSRAIAGGVVEALLMLEARQGD